MMQMAVETKDKALETQLQTERDLKIEQMMMALNEADDEAGIVILKGTPTLPHFLPTAPKETSPVAAKMVPPTKKVPTKKNAPTKKGTKKYDSSDEDEDSDDFMGNDSSDSEVM
jgi:hypothetical protein